MPLHYVTFGFKPRVFSKLLGGPNEISPKKLQDFRFCGSKVLYAKDMVWLTRALTSGPHIVERLLRVFPTDRLDDRIEADRYTAREVIAHLADYEQVVLERCRCAKLKPGTEVPSYDPDARAAEHKYHTKDVFREAEVFESRRMMTLELLADFTPDDWEKTFVIAGGSSWTVKEYMSMILSHDLGHVDQISAYLATEVATIA
jgi:hypothetical protein